jgi:hypothetical protein
MPPTQDLDPAVRAVLTATYQEMMWLAARPNVSAAAARTWYSHVRAAKVVRTLRRFSGMVSRKAAESDPRAALRLEHFKRMQTIVTKMIERHRKLGTLDPDEFVRILIDCERVHVVTFAENYDAMRADGDYEKAGIELLPWRTLSLEKQAFLWKRMLRGRVSNAGDFKPMAIE